MSLRGAAVVACALALSGAVAFACRAVQGRAPQAPASTAPSVAVSTVFPDATAPTFEAETTRASAAGFVAGEVHAVAPEDGGVAREVLATLATDGCVRVAARATSPTTLTVRVAGVERWEPELLPGEAKLSGPLCGRAKDVVAVEVRGGPMAILPYTLKDSRSP